MFRRLADRVTGRQTGDRLASLERAVRKLGDGERDRSAPLATQLAEIARALGGQPTAKDVREFKQALRSVAVRDPQRQLFDALDRMASSGRPLLIGPWTGEVGFELLYWIPFLEWVRAQWPLAPDRELVVSRGGVASWYGRDAAGYVDIFSLFGPEEFRTAVADEKRKHRRPGAFDDRVMAAVTQHRGLGEVDLLHPGIMYRAFAPYWNEEAGYALIDQFTRPRLLDRPTDAVPVDLPTDYVAVRFYFSECFPATEENRMFARGAVSSLAERTPVVILNPGFSMDEHSDWMPDAGHHIVTMTDGLTPDRNLAVQSAVIAGARGFVGTYGGYSYLAPLYKVPAVAFYSRPSFKLHHLHAAQRAFSQIGAAALTPIDVAQTRLVRAALGALVAA